MLCDVILSAIQHHFPKKAYLLVIVLEVVSDPSFLSSAYCFSTAEAPDPLSSLSLLQHLYVSSEAQNAVPEVSIRKVWCI